MSTTRLGGRQVAWMMAAFVGTIFAVNGALVIYSIDSWPGLETESAYVTGLAYNRRLEAAAAQRARGWRAEIALVPLGSGSARLDVTYRDRLDAALGGLAVTARLVRPTHAGLDFTVTLDERGDGLYAGEFAVPEPGNWDLTLEARRDGEAPELHQARLWIP